MLLLRCRWNSALVQEFCSKPGKDSHGNFGPLHTLMYEDGEFDEVFDGATKFEIALHDDRAVGEREGAADIGMSGASAGDGSRRAPGGAETQRRDGAEPAGGNHTPDAKHADTKSSRERKSAPYRQRPPPCMPTHLQPHTRAWATRAHAHTHTHTHAAARTTRVRACMCR